MQRFGLKVGVVLVAVGAIAIGSAREVVAQSIVPDNTLGSTWNGSRIEGGAIRGSNLFHSFQEFGIPAGAAAYFANPSGVDNIFGRVTGGNRSDILGTLGVAGPANLFLSNEAGFLFGKNAKLDIRGSFTATTSGFVFSNGYEFSGTNPTTPPLLNIGVPLGLQRGTNPTGGTIINEATLEMQLGEDILLFGHQVEQKGKLVAKGGTARVWGEEVNFTGDADVGTLEIVANTLQLLDAAHSTQGFNILSWKVIDSLSGVDTLRLQTTGNMKVADVTQGVTGGSIGSPNFDSILLEGLDLELISTDGNVEFEKSEDQIWNQGGNVTIFGNHLILGDILTRKRDLLAFTASESGAISLEARNSISAGELDSGSLVFGINDIIGTGKNVFAGRGGEITVTTTNPGSSIEIDTIRSSSLAGSIDADVSGESAGNVTINSAGTLTVGDVSSFALAVTQTGQNTSTQFQHGGDISLIANGDITLAGSLISSGNSSGGDISIVSQFGGVHNSHPSLIHTGSISQEDIDVATGIVPVSSRNRVDEAYTDTVTKLIPTSLSTGDYLSYISGDGKPGDLTVRANKDIVLDQTLINMSGSDGSVTGNPTSGGSAIFESVTGALDFKEVFLRTTSYSGDFGSNLTLKGKSLSADQTVLVTRIEGTAGRSGTVDIETDDFVHLSEQSFIGTQGRQPDIVIGDVNVKTGDLLIEDGSLFSAVARDGVAGNIRIEADSVQVIGDDGIDGVPSMITSSVSGQGMAGTVIIQAQENVSVVDGGMVVAGATIEGQGGSVEIRAGSVLVTGVSEVTGLSSVISTDSRNAGSAGTLKINADGVTVNKGGFISTSTFGDGSSGEIQITADRIQLRGTSPDGRVQSGIFSRSFSEGDAGSIIIRADQLIVEDSAQVSVNSDPFAQDAQNFLANANGVIDALKQIPSAQIDNDFVLVAELGSGDAGNVDVTVNQILLTDQAELVAVSASNQGGNIRLDVSDLLLMRHQSRISATAGTARTPLADGDGGNIQINAGFVVAVPLENSDITANAFRGRGGRINIVTNGIYGLEFRDRLTSLSDITVSSELGIDGIFALNLLALDPTQDLQTLPTVLESPEIASACQEAATSNAASSKFIIVGAGGLAPNPGSHSSSTNIYIPFLTLADSDLDVTQPTNVEAETLELMPLLAACGI